MDWLEENVDGRIPAYDELTELDQTLLMPLVTRYAEKNGDTLAKAEESAGAGSGNRCLRAVCKQLGQRGFLFPLQ